MNNEFDATIYVSLVEVLTTNHLEIEEVFSKLSSVLASQGDLQYTNLENVLGLIMIYTTPIVYTNEQVYSMVQSLISEEVDLNALDLEEFSNWIVGRLGSDRSIGSLLRTASDLLIDTSQKRQFNFKGIHRDEILFQFVKSKTIADSKYYDGDDFQLCYGLLSHYEPFVQWFRGIIQPYLYYHVHTQNRAVKFEDYLGSEFNKFDLFVDSLDYKNSQHSVGTIKLWLTNTVIPYIDYSQDLEKFIIWISNLQDKTVSRYKFWHTVIEAFSLKSAKVDDLLVETYVSQCYFDAIHLGMSTVETMQIYDTMIETLTLLPQDGRTSTTIAEGNIQDVFIDLSISDKNDFDNSSFKSLFGKPETLLSIVRVCQKLYPFNQMTISKFIQLKGKESSNTEIAELKKILNNLSSNNYVKVVESAQYFAKLFINESPEVQMRAQRIISQKLLDESIFDSSLFQAHSDSDELISNKMRQLIESATKLHDRNLEQVKECTKLLSQSAKNDASKFEHLLNAIDAMKGYRISLRQKSIIPKDLTCPDVDQLALISKILDLNPRAYSNYDKLFSILDDLLKFHQTHLANPEGDLKCLCIESALKQDDFEYASQNAIQLIKEKKGQYWQTLCQVAAWHGKGSESKWILYQQREILSLVLGFPDVDNMVILKQWESLNSKLNEVVNRENESFLLEDNESIVTDVNNVRVSSQVNNSNNLNEMASDATRITGDTISNLFVSGLGWAIGANQT